jgi:uncharacterized protein
MIKNFISQRKLAISIFLSLVFLTLIIAVIQASSETNQQAVIFHTTTGTHKIILEVAKTDEEKTLGLMYRQSLADNAGMVFVYNEPTDAGIWMKNTDLPLDIIFIDCDNTVVDFVTRTPQTLDISYPPVKICKIIEVNAGLNKKITLEKGNKVNFVPSI